MGYVVGVSYKHRLVIEICSASKRTCKMCTHRPCRRARTHFVDWYILLGVEDDADVDVIRKSYRKLALQVHPDKNDHPNAEMAFTLILDAYRCLSDPTKRSAFDVEKRKSACPGCRHPSGEDKVPDLGKLRNVRDRFREEARVIEACLRCYAKNPETKADQQCSPSNTVWEAPTNLSSEKKGNPVFDPSRYESNGYPHVRNRVYKGTWGHWRSRTAADGSPVFGSDKSWDRCWNRSRSVC